MVLGMGIASFTCDNFHLIDTFFSLSKNCKLKNLAKVEKMLTFLRLAFFDVE